MTLFLYRLKYLLRSKANLFWTFGFPLALATFFYLAFGQLTEDDFLETKDLYVVTDDQMLIQYLSALEIEDGRPLFHIHTDRTIEELEQSLKEQAITGYVYTDGETIVYRINSNGLYQTITKSILDQYVQIKDLILTVSATDPSKLEQVLQSIQQPIHFLAEPYSPTDSKASRLVIYFYSLVASQAIWGSFWGVGLVSDLQANLSDRAMRVNISPTHKFRFIVIHFLAALFVHFMGALLLFLYLQYILDISFGEQTGLIILGQFIGSIAGIAFGALLTSLLRGSLNTREAIISVASTFLGFLAGLMNVQIKFMIEKALPFIKYINPVSLLTDALYSLFYYQDLRMYFQNITVLAMISILFVFISFFRLRGTRYDSI